MRRAMGLPGGRRCINLSDGHRRKMANFFVLQGSLTNRKPYPFDDGPITLVRVEKIKRRIVLHPEQPRSVLSIAFLEKGQGLLPAVRAYSLDLSEAHSTSHLWSCS
jgi:hypothetical protein